MASASSFFNRKHTVLVIVLLVINFFCWKFASIAIVATMDAEALPRQILLELHEPAPLADQYVGQGKGKTRLLYRDYEDVHGKEYVPRSQTGPSCVGNATACAIDILGAVEAKTGWIESPPPRASAAWLYGTSRELGGMRKNSAGSHVRLAVQAANEVGFIYEDNYFLLGIDLTKPNNYERVWRNGPPSELQPLASNFVAAYYKLYDYNDVRDAISSGMPVIIGSHVGFGPHSSRVLYRDKDGFLSQPMFRFRGKYWFHAMCFIGESDVGRPGVLCQNSWGSGWVKGPQKFGDEPRGSFWIDPVTVNKMVRHGDCFAIIGIKRL